MQARSLAYSLSQAETGWLWSVIDEDGETVARGADISRRAAEAAVNAMLASAAVLLCLPNLSV